MKHMIILMTKIKKQSASSPEEEKFKGIRVKYPLQADTLKKNTKIHTY